MKHARRLLASRTADPLLAVVLLAIAELEAAGAGETWNFGLAIPFFTLTLIWRRTKPLEVAFGAALANAVLALGPEIDFPSVAAMIGMFVVMYSAGAYLDTARARVAPVLMVLAIVVQTLLQGGG